MVKEPRPGRVKTRLARDIGAVPAAWWYRHQCRRLLRRLAGGRRWELVLAVSPDAEGRASRVWPPGLSRLPQGRGDLGARMRRLLAQGGGGPVLVVGSDIPGIGPRQIARAFAALGGRDAVIGPAGDGGYWLVGLARPMFRPHLFRGVRWSGPHALADTLASFSGMRVARADMLDDVDTGADLARASSPAQRGAAHARASRPGQMAGGPAPLSCRPQTALARLSSM